MAQDEHSTLSKEAKQQRLTQDYADFLAIEAQARAQGKAIGGFIAWRHENNREGIKIDDSRKR